MTLKMIQKKNTNLKQFSWFYGVEMCIYFFCFITLGQRLYLIKVLIYFTQRIYVEKCCSPFFILKGFYFFVCLLYKSCLNLIYTYIFNVSSFEMSNEHVCLIVISICLHIKYVIFEGIFRL